jgi:hypothetical protein
MPVSSLLRGDQLHEFMETLVEMVEVQAAGAEKGPVGEDLPGAPHRHDPPSVQDGDAVTDHG